MEQVVEIMRLNLRMVTTGDTELTFSISGTEWTDVSLDFPAGLGSYGRMVIFTDFGPGWWRSRRHLFS